MSIKVSYESAGRSTYDPIHDFVPFEHEGLRRLEALRTARASGWLAAQTAKPQRKRSESFPKQPSTRSRSKTPPKPFELPPGLDAETREKILTTLRAKGLA